jgi:hypothetical protein
MPARKWTQARIFCINPSGKSGPRIAEIRTERGFRHCFVLTRDDEIWVISLRNPSLRAYAIIDMAQKIGYFME